eukprot:gene6345-6579_t
MDLIYRNRKRHGIRSFSPDNNNVIEFYKPLTLIVGSNGAGKTTIIECLKQACTGELPPNVGGNGRNWVMDPKVAGETEVKAQIKLRLRASTQMPFVVVRSFQSVQKKATLQFKSLDATLQTYNKVSQKKEAITYRCADINTMVPSLMGVSKAVLDNVIFVHQEESNWPLADGATIKRKFDEIFAATKYTKALDTLRKLRLEKTQEAREMRLKLETLKSHKDAAAKLSSQVAEGRSKAGALQAEIGALEATMNAQETEMRLIDQKLSQIADVADEITKLLAQSEVVATSTSDKLARLKGNEYEETDEELQQFYDVTRAELEDNSSIREQRVNELRVKQMDAASYEERLQQQAGDSSMIGSGGTGPGHSADVAPLSVRALELFLSELRSRRSRLQDELHSTKEAHRAQGASLSSSIDAANADLARAQQEGSVKAADLEKMKRRRENLHQQMMHLASAPYQAEDLALQEQELSSKLEAKKSEETRLNLEGQLQDVRRQIEAGGVGMTALRAERDSLIMLKKLADAALKQKENELKMRSEQLRRLEGQLAIKKGDLTARRRERVSAETKCQEMRAELRRAVSGLPAPLPEPVLAALGTSNEPEAFTRALESVEKARSMKFKRHQGLTAFEKVMGSLIDDSKTESACALCHRPFDNQAMMNAVVEEMNQQLSELPARAALLESEVADLDNQLRGMNNLLGTLHALTDLEGHLPQLRSQKML